LTARLDEIIEAATDLFYEKGFEKASLRDIALKVGITQAAIYYHFRNKEQILYTIIEIYSTEILFVLNGSLSGKADPLDKLKNAITRHIIFMTTKGKGAKIAIEDKIFLSGEFNRLVRAKEKSVYNFYMNCLAELQQTGQIGSCDLTATTFSILGMVNWIYHWYKPAGGLTVKQVSDDIINMIFYGILANRKEAQA
jgi:AcrR family transcriptional regulator